MTDPTRPPAPSEGPVTRDDAVPTCGTSPLGRLTWTLRELRSLFPARNKEETRAR